MKRKLKLGLLFAGTLVLCLPAFSAILRSPSPGNEPSKAEFYLVKSQRAELTVKAYGSVKAEKEVKISPKQAGVIKELLVDQGDYVEKGDVIARMDQNNLRGQLLSAKGSYASALQTLSMYESGSRPQEIAKQQAQVSRAISTSRNAALSLEKLQNDLESSKATAERDQSFASRQLILSKEGAISEQDYLNAKTQSTISSRQVASLEIQLDQAKQALLQADADLRIQRQQLDLVTEGFRQEEIEATRQNAMQQKGNLEYLRSLSEDTILRAPFSGRIIHKYADAGSFVTPSAAAATSSATSSSIVVLASRPEVVAEVPEASIAQIFVNQPVTVDAVSFPDTQFKGKVSKIAPAAVSSSNVTVFEVHVRLDEAGSKYLKSGMNVSASFLCGSAKNALLVPVACAVTRNGARGVMVLDTDKVPVFRSVTFGNLVGHNIIVKDGLKEGEKVQIGSSGEKPDERSGLFSGIKPPRHIQGL